MGDEEKLPEWLPSDWTMEVRKRRDGRTYKCFKDPASDLKFYSKPDVLRHLKNVSVKHSISKKTKRKSTNKRNKPATYVVKKAVAEGLPPGWIEEIKVRKKQGREKRIDKYYIDPESGRVFRSMKEVSRYLETGELGRSILKSKEKGHVNEEPSNHTSSSTRAEYEKISAPKSETSKKISKDQAMKSAAEGEGVEITKSKANKEVDKDGGKKSSAEGEGDRVPDREGSRYERDKRLKRRKKEEVVKDQELKSSAEGEGGERDRAPDSNTNEVVEVQDLKSGAEGEGDRVSDGKGAGDEPDKMPKRRKKKEVVKDQDLKSSAETGGGETDRAPDSKTNEEVVKDQDLKSCAEGEGDGVPDGKSSGDERDKMPKRKKIREVVKDQDLKSSAEVKGGERDRALYSQTNEVVVQDQDLKSGSKGTRKRIKTLPTDKKLAKRKKESNISGSTSALTSLKADEIEKKLPPVNGVERPKNNKPNDETGAAMPRRTSKRLAGVEVHQLQEIETNSRARQVASEQLSETVDISKNIKDLNSTDKHIRKVQKGNASDVKRQGPVLLPAGYLPLSQDHVKALGTGFKRDEDVAVPLDSSINDFLNDPCIEFAIKTLTGTVQIGDNNAHNPGCSASNANPSSCLATPCGNLWTDPCFEFAVKTLTGEISLEDDSCIKTLFQQPLNSAEAQRHNG